MNKSVDKLRIFQHDLTKFRRKYEDFSTVDQCISPCF